MYSDLKDAFVCSLSLLTLVVEGLWCDGAVARGNLSVVESLKRVSLAVRFRVLAKSKVTCLRVLTRTRLLKRGVTRSSLDNLVRKTGAHCRL